MAATAGLQAAPAMAVTSYLRTFSIVRREVLRPSLASEGMSRASIWAKAVARSSAHFAAKSRKAASISSSVEAGCSPMAMDLAIPSASVLTKR